MYEIRIDEERREVVTVWGESITDEAILAYQREVWGNPGLKGFNEIMDFSAVEVPDVTAEGLKALAREAASMDARTGSGRTAIVVEKPYYFGMARMYESYRSTQDESQRELQVFTDLASAMSWVRGMQEG